MTLEENVRIIRVRKEGQQPYRTRGIWQYDRGHVLVFEDFGLPETFQVHFAQSADGEARPQVGQNDTCALPDAYTQSSGTVYAWVYVADLETGLTKCLIKIPVESRGENTDEEPTPVQESALDQAIAALNSGVARAETAAEAAEESQGAAEESAEAAEGSAETAEKWAAGTRGGVAVPDTDPAYHNNSKYYAQQAAESERNAGESEDAAAESESNAEGWAAGTRGGVAVPDTDPAYHNNSKYYAQQAARSAEEATGTLNRAVETITQEKTAAITAVQQKGQETTEAITQQKNAAVEAVRQKGQQVLDSIPADYTEMSEALDAAPTEETAAQLLAAEITETELLGAILKSFSELPTDEALQEIRAELQEENGWLEVIQSEVKARMEAV